MKKIISLSICFLVLASFFPIVKTKGNPLYQKTEISFTVKKFIYTISGWPNKLDITPLWDEQNQTILLPLRFLMNLLSYEVKWEPATHLATFSYQNITFSVKIQADKLLIQSTPKLTSYKILLKGNRIFLDIKSIGSLSHVPFILDRDDRKVTLTVDRSQIKITVPDFTLKDIPGNTFNLYNTLKNNHTKLVLLNFYSTKCPICAKALPGIEKIYEDYQKKGILVVGINTDTQQMEEARDEVIKKYNLTYPILLDSEAKVYSLYSVAGIPNLFVIDKNGRLIQHQLGVDEDYLSYVRTYLDNYLKSH